MLTMIDKTQISACLIVKNEEKMLPGCLESLIGYTHEIIIVNTGSDDSTIKIAMKYGCRVFDYKWDDDFSKARNFALSKAVYPYILSIDADERLKNPELLKLVIENSAFQVGGWLIKVTSDAKREDGCIDTFTANLLRLFRNDERIRFEGIIHEQIHNSILNSDFTIQDTQLEIIHLGYNFSKEDMRNKQLRNLELLNRTLSKNPTKSYDLFQRAKTLLALNKVAEAENDIQSAIKYADSGKVLLPQILNYGSIAARKLDNILLSKSRAEQSLKILPNQSFANFNLAEIHFELNDYKKALEHYLNMDDAQNKYDKHNSIAGDYKIPQEQLAFKIGRCYMGLKEEDTAFNYFKIGNNINPKDSSCLTGIANVLFNRKKYSESREYLLKAKNFNPSNTRTDNFINIVDEEIRKSQNINVKKIEFHEPSEDLKSSEGYHRKLLSLSMIVKNEENSLPGCLENMKGIADEIIIVDTGSTDNTIQIAEKYGAKIFHFAWVNDFAAARNESLKHCTCEWVLYLDADERLNKMSRITIRNLLIDTPENVDGYVCNIESSHLQLDGSSEKHRGGYPRIFRNLGYPTIKFEGRVHEQIAPSIFALGRSIDFSNITIDHLGYNQSREVMEAKIRRNYQLLLAHVKEEPENAYAWFQLGQTLAQMQLLPEAEKTIRLALQLGSLSDSIYASAASTLSQLVGSKSNFAEALYWAEKSLEKAPEQAFALNLKGFALLQLNQLDQAEAVLNEVISRLHNKKGIPQSGFDVQISEEIVLNGLKEIRIKREHHG